MSSGENSVSSLGHTNNRLRGTHWVLSPELGEPQKTHWVRCLKPYSPKPYSPRFRMTAWATRRARQHSHADLTTLLHAHLELRPVSARGLGGRDKTCAWGPRDLLFHSSLCLGSSKFLSDLSVSRWGVTCSNFWECLYRLLRKQYQSNTKHWSQHWCRFGKRILEINVGIGNDFLILNPP